jgi:hypothetical protein
MGWYCSRVRFVALVVGFVGCVVAACSQHGGQGVDAGDPNALSEPPKSCSLTCPLDGCGETQAPYACPALAAWSALPHADVCAAWDGTYPAPTPTKCTVSAAGGDAVKYAGPDPDDKSLTILPDGRRVRAMGADWFLDEPDIQGGGPVSVIALPPSNFLAVVDAGYGAHAVHLVDQTKVVAGSGQSPVTSYVRFPAPKTLNDGVVFVAPDLLLVATDDGVVQGLTVDTTMGTVSIDDTRSIALPKSIDDVGNAAAWYVSGLALSPDSTRLFVTGVFDHHGLVVDVTSGAGYGKQLGTVDLGGAPTQEAAFDPNDATGHFVYVSLQNPRKLVEVDVSKPASPSVTRTWDTDKNPYGIAFLDARWVAVANDFGDTITLVDRAANSATSVPVDLATPLHGEEPTSLAYDAANKRLYATLAGANAVAAWNVDTTAAPPKLAVAGRIPTSWWTTDVRVLASGALAITNMRGKSSGADPVQYPVANGNPSRGPMFGSVQIVPAPSDADLAKGATDAAAFDDVANLAGTPTVTCPGGENDFPLPPTNTEGPSKQIDHVFFVVRENKTFDGLFGDLPGVNGAPGLTMKKSSADMDALWTNLRAAARQFAISDDYYTSAEVSVQGHVWTVFGRSFDFDERQWFLTGYGGRQVYNTPATQPQGIADNGRPAEGSVFDWLAGNNVEYDVTTEALAIVSAPPVDGHQPIHFDVPGGATQQGIGYPDVERACYLAAHVRALCDLGNFVYSLLPNDHTSGVGPGTPSPEAMVAVNDEATGMLIDAIAHSPWWKSSLVVVTEDDPSDGGDHVENHRTPVLFVSPWVKHGYVSKQHIDVSSLHKVFAHVFGIPYPNAIVAGAALPLDLFTSTPDYTPFTYKPRTWPLSCGQAPSLAEQSLRESWGGDVGDIDEQPGLGAQVWRHMRGEEADHVTPAMQTHIDESVRRRRRLASPHYTGE